MRNAYSVNQSSRVRLLFRGKVLEGHTELAALDPSATIITIHCAVTNPPASVSSSGNTRHPHSSSRGRRPRQEATVDDSSEPILGFERLRYMGFSEEEIQLARNQVRP